MLEGSPGIEATRKTNYGKLSGGTISKNVEFDSYKSSNVIRFDPDCEGFVSLEELRFVLANLPVKISHKELEEMMEAADPDGDGKLSLEEFRTLLGM